MIQRDNTLSEIFWYAGTVVYSVIFILSGILKAWNPTFIINTTQFLFYKTLGKELPWGLLIFLISLVILWEVVLGILLLLQIQRKIMLSLMCSTIIVFIVISHYLNHYGLLASCGCFGSLSNFFYNIHFWILYSGVLFSLVALITQKVRT